MPDIDLTKTDIPFLLDGSGSLHVQANVADLDQPLAPGDEDFFNLGFNAAGGHSFAIGAQDSVKLGIEAKTSARLIPLWASSSIERLKLLENYGLSGYFDPAQNHAGRLLLLLALGAEMDASVSGKYSYSVLSLDATLKAGADAGYALVRSYPAGTAARGLITDFFKGLRLPANVSAPLAADEVIVFEYGGYLQFNASLGVGYELSGAPSFEISQLAFSEKYAFSLIGKVSLGASVAGRFKVEVRGGAEQGWARITVRKSHASSFSVAADVTASATFEQKGLPETPNEFLSALIGLNSKNWLNLFEQIHDLTDFNKLQAYLDNLAKSFIEEYTGKAFDALADRTQLNEVLARINKAVDAYNHLGDHAVTLFDRYYDAAQNKIDDRLRLALDTIKNATSWDVLKDAMNGGAAGILWNVVNQLTEGDPLGWMLGHVQLDGHHVDSLNEIKGRADKALQLIQGEAHEELRRVIALAKSKFPLDRFAQELAHLDWVELQKMTDRRLIGFVERLIGKTIANLGNTELGKVVSRFHETLAAVKKFETTLYDKIKAALDESFQFQLHAEYSRATEQTALLDFEIDLRTDIGKRLMKAAGHGNFAEVLDSYDGGAVKLHEGALTHKVTKQSKFNVNIIGWHLGWNYQGLDRVITQSEQRINADAGGQLTIITTFDLQKERERKRQGERVYTNLLLRFIGESKGKVQFDPGNQTYLVDVITGMAARYNLVIDDESTTQQELAQYLSFADDFGLTASDEATEAALVPLLPTDAHGNYGAVSVHYDVRFTEEGLRALFTTAFIHADELFLRRIMRLVVLANYIGKGSTLAARAWCYWTPGIQAEWAKGQAAFTNHTSLQFSPIAPSPFKNLMAPASATLRQTELQQLSTLYYIEDSMIKGVGNLARLVQSPGQINPREFESKLGDFGDALKLYDDFDEGENTVFALFDKLIQRSAAGAQTRHSSLTLTSTLNGRTATKMLIA